MLVCYINVKIYVKRTNEKRCCKYLIEEGWKLGGSKLDDLGNWSKKLTKNLHKLSQNGTAQNRYTTLIILMSEKHIMSDTSVAK